MELHAGGMNDGQSVASRPRPADGCGAGVDFGASLHSSIASIGSKLAR